MSALPQIEPARLPEFNPPVSPLWLAQFKHFVDIEVRYCETDSARHVNHVTVPAYLEHGLLMLLRSIGGTKHFAGLAFDHVTAELVVRYLEPSVFGESLRVGSRLVRVGRSSAVIEQVVLGDCDSIRVTGRTVIVHTRDGRSEPWTADQRACLVAHAGSSL